ncbi:hypothetical protein [Bacillus badius]|uniref:hypothetical protein n=1 Tax=Bacillus badius TaxID=1455 RepID=UPI000596CC4B|nr:hypothetical protein [Bacillus badius]KIL74368.1 hypothetical protein SD78_1437 [Bacillus badius]
MSKQEKELEIRGLTYKDIFPMSKIISKLNIKLKFEKGLSQEEIGFELASRVLSGLHLAEKEITDFLSSLLQVKPKELERLGFEVLFEVFSQLSKSEEFDRFLKLASK